MALIQIFNGPAPTTGAQQKVTTGTAIKTMLQVTGTRKFKIVEWGISFDGAAAAAGIQCGLIETGTVFATVTAHVVGGLHNISDPDGEAATTVYGITVGTAATGYTATAEGTITTSRAFDHQIVQPTNQYVKQFPLDREPVVNHATAARIRVLAAAAVNAVCYMTIEI